MASKSVNTNYQGEVDGVDYLFGVQLFAYSKSEADMTFVLRSFPGGVITNIWEGNFEDLVHKLLGTNEPDVILVRAIADEPEVVGEKV